MSPVDDIDNDGLTPGTDGSAVLLNDGDGKLPSHLFLSPPRNHATSSSPAHTLFEAPTPSLFKPLPLGALVESLPLGQAAWNHNYETKFRNQYKAMKGRKPQSNVIAGTRQRPGRAMDSRDVVLSWILVDGPRAEKRLPGAQKR